jgi:hypothetical protein
MTLHITEEEQKELGNALSSEQSYIKIYKHPQDYYLRIQFVSYVGAFMENNEIHTGLHMVEVYKKLNRGTYIPAGHAAGADRWIITGRLGAQLLRELTNKGLIPPHVQEKVRLAIAFDDTFGGKRTPEIMEERGRLKEKLNSLYQKKVGVDDIVFD